MAGGYYAALSGMRVRLDELDRLSSDIANAGTAGYKTERAGTDEADRPSFDNALQSAIDVTAGRAIPDLRSGALAPTGRPLDVAIEGSGFFVVDTPAGERYTRNGHLIRRADGTLSTEDGSAVLGASGPIRLGDGAVHVDADGTVRSDGAIVGTLKVVDFDKNAGLVREGASRFRANGPATPVESPAVAEGSLEDSNVSLMDRVAELTEVSRSFDALSRSISQLNDLDKNAITELGRR